MLVGIVMPINIIAQPIESVSATERLLTIGEAFIQAGNSDKALHHFQDALSAATTMNEKWEATDRLGRLYVQKERYKDALNCYDALLLDNSIQNYPTVMMHIYGSVGWVYDKMKDYVKAIKSYNEAKRYVIITKDETFIPSLYRNIAQTLIVAGDLQDARQHLDSAMIVGQKFNDEASLTEIYNTWAQFYNAIGDYEKAYNNLYQHTILYKQLRYQEINTIMNSTNPLEVHQKVETIVKYEKRIKELEEQVDEYKKMAQRSGYISYVIFVVALFLLGVAVWRVVVGRKNRKLVAQLSKNIEEKRQVMSIVAHDFVNPFNALIGFAELQLQYALAQDDKEQADYSRMIYNSSQVLYQLVGNVLAWSQLDGQLKPKRTQLNLSHEMEKVVSVCRLMSEDKGVHVSASIDDSVEIFVDENHFSIIMRNLILNAIKFTKQGGRVTVTGVTFGNKTSITVDDTGIGMPPSKIRAILEQNTVESTIGTNKEKGMGLGLIICRDLVRSNHGQFDILSTEGKGTTITITFDNIK